mgnify:FL=1
MTERVEKLRKESLEVQARISMERAVLMTQAYEKYEGRVPVPVLRALAFKHIMENKHIDIYDGELIVGERGPSPAHTPTFPELCCHSSEDFEIIDKREKIFFKTDEQSKKIQREKIIPFWQERALRGRILAMMSQEWKDCYSAGMFTEFMEQRGPGHTVADDKIYRKGFLDFKNEIKKSIELLDWEKDFNALNKYDELTAMDICCDAIITYARRYSALAQKKSEEEKNEKRKEELQEISRICRKVPEYKPDTVHEALQMYWFVHIGVISEMNNWDSFNPGRLDQHLFPFYSKQLMEGTIDREKAKELLECFWVKFNNQPAPPKVGVTLKESSTYTDFANINIGGLKSDGSDGVNELSYLLLEVVDEMRLLQPSSNVQISKKSPDAFLLKALDVIKKGWGQPSVFNADAVVQEMILAGKSIEDARCGGTSGCVETGAFGKEAYILTGYFNLPKVLEITLNNGYDTNTGKQIGLNIKIEEAENYSQFFEIYKKQLNHFIDIKLKGNMIIEKMYSKYIPVPFLSVVIDDCIKKGSDYNSGGARYNTSYIQGVGIGSITDSLSSLKQHVFEEKKFSVMQVKEILAKNFSGYDDAYKLFKSYTHKYGNDDDYADSIMKEVFEAFYSCVTDRNNVKGGKYRIDMLPTTCHIYFGSVCGASADGRKAFEPLSEGISPARDADQNGPTAVIKSASKMDHIRTGGTLLNQKFLPSVFEDQENIVKIKDLIRVYFKRDGHHIQFNVVSRDTLLKAQKNPQQYSNLIVRVAGYSDYFNNLSPELQNEIINRTEQQI